MYYFPSYETSEMYASRTLKGDPSGLENSDTFGGERSL